MPNLNRDWPCNISTVEESLDGNVWLTILNSYALIQERNLHVLILNFLEIPLISLKTDGIGKCYTMGCVNNEIMHTIGYSIGILFHHC